MKMNTVEKHFVHSHGHAANVALHADELLEHCALRSAQRYLDVGCGIGTAARRIAETRALDVIGIDIGAE